MKVIENIRVGKPDTTPSKSAHTWGVRQGNRPHSVIGESGHAYAGGKRSGPPHRKGDCPALDRHQPRGQDAHRSRHAATHAALD